MIDVLNFPASLQVTNHGLTANDNTGQEIMPFSGTVQRLAPTFERFAGTWTFRAPKAEDSPEIEAFFLQVNGGRALFQTSVLSKAANLATMGGSVDGVHNARAGEVAVTGLPKNRQIEAGAWVQIGWQAGRLLKTASVDSSGDATLTIFPFLHAEAPDGEEVRIGRWVKILWRLVGEPVNWSHLPSRHHSLEVSLSAVQEIVSDNHELYGEDLPA